MVSLINFIELMKFKVYLLLKDNFCNIKFLRSKYSHAPKLYAIDGPLNSAKEVHGNKITSSKYLNTNYL